MKVEKLHFINHPVFGRHTIVFGDTTIPDICFLVGNNGSGKTNVLETLYEILSLDFQVGYFYEVEAVLFLSETERNKYQLKVNRLVYFVRKTEKGIDFRLKPENGDDIEFGIREISKIVYSTIEVNFGDFKIHSVTTKNIDEAELPKEKSRKLSEEIPQLLVDIKSLDDADIAKWYEGVRGTAVQGAIPSSIGRRMDRFSAAFHKMLGGTKLFNAVSNRDNYKRIDFLDSNGALVELNDLSTGEKQIIYRVGFILKQLGSMDGGVILIDEPEIGLHPKWQMKIKDFLLELFDEVDIQLIIATHSPYVFQSLNEPKEVCINVDRAQDESQKVGVAFPRMPYSPSVNLISYIVYGIPSTLLHIELYSLLQIRENRDHIRNSRGKDDGIEDWLRDPNGGNMPVAQTFRKSGNSGFTEESLMTWIRNKIHHQDELARPTYSLDDLKRSIDEMIRLLKMG